MAKLRLLLLPFSWLYAAITAIRNRLFDTGHLSVTQYQLPVISIGNLTVGGTGKTPLTEHLIRLLLPNYHCAILSRGYGRKTKGVILADDATGYEAIGDEPMQMKRKFGQLTVAVAEKRVLGVEKLLSIAHPPQIILMDDAYQHRYVKPGLSVLVMDFYRPIWNDHCLPAGNLREPRTGTKRADIIVVNKCPENLSLLEAEKIKSRLNPLSHQELYFTSIAYKNPVPLNENSSGVNFESVIAPRATVIALAGIGNPLPFFRMAAKFGEEVIPISYPDHHHFTQNDILQIQRTLSKGGSHSYILTTEKDAIRLNATRGMTNALQSRIWYIPIELKFLFDAQPLFDKKITDYVGKN